MVSNAMAHPSQVDTSINKEFLPTTAKMSSRARPLAETFAAPAAANATTCASTPGRVQARILGSRSFCLIAASDLERNIQVAFIPPAPSATPNT